MRERLATAALALLVAGLAAAFLFTIAGCSEQPRPATTAAGGGASAPAAVSPSPSPSASAWPPRTWDLIVDPDIRRALDVIVGRDA